MRSNFYFYHLDTKSKPGTIIMTGLRFETIELEGTKFDEASFNVLCEAHPELKDVHVKALAQTLKQNFPSAL